MQERMKYPAFALPAGIKGKGGVFKAINAGGPLRRTPRDRRAPDPPDQRP
ncbi:hypothetical protein ACFV9D_13615 [Streptomyces sp. NPDC059875]